MSSISSRSKLSPRAAPHAIPQATMDAHGAPLDNLRFRNWGAQPSSAIATGRREYDTVSELRIPKVLTRLATTSAIPSHAPPTSDPMPAQLPLSHKPP